MSEGFPKLLVAAEFAPNASGGGPAVVRQMLKDWPVEKLLWWSCLPENGRMFGQLVAGHRVAVIPRKLYPHRRWCRQKSWLLENLWSPWAASHFRRTLKEFQPEAVWVIPHQWAIPALSRALEQAHVGFHVTMQDYMDAASSMARFGAARCGRLVAGADHLYCRATTRDATSHPMIADLEARTGAHATQMLHAGLEPEDLAYLARGTIAQSAEEIRIAYAGTILVEAEFALFIKVLGDLRSQLKARLTLELFSSHSYHARPWFNPEWMRERGNLPASQLTQELRKCSWGFSPMALTDTDPRYNRFSFPTKFISYLAAGLPIISLGHPESSVIKMSRNYQVGLCLATQDSKIIEQELLAALAGADPRARFRGEILRCAKTEFDAVKMREALHACFRKCAAGLNSRLREN